MSKTNRRDFLLSAASLAALPLAFSANAEVKAAPGFRFVLPNNVKYFCGRRNSGRCGFSPERRIRD